MTSRFSRRVGILLVIVVTLLAGSSVFAQGGPFATTTETLAEVIAKLNQILVAVSPAPPEPGPVTLTTGPLFRGLNDNVWCNITNLGSSALEVSLRMLDEEGSVRVEGSETIAPHATWIHADASRAILRCEFSFVGFASDVRANGQAVDIDTLRAAVVLEAR